MPRRVPDLSKIGALVGYRPTTTLDEMLRAVIEFYTMNSGSERELEASAASAS